ncbi:uncharacterized protein TNCV_1782761 [Trichonephila clavipes]|nr:uncharacterized protein TNCV_1782761 [Trichonephila clavipes]
MRGTLNSHRSANPLMRLVEGDENWEPSDQPLGAVSQNWGGHGPNCTVPCIVLKTTANDMRHFGICHDEFLSPQYGFYRSVDVQIAR